jgi:glucoamylase
VAKFRGNREAFGWPGLEPRWTNGNKDGVGTAYSADSRVWFTILDGILTEIFWPTVDSPQVRDLQYLITDGETLFKEERRDLISTVELGAAYGLGYRIASGDPEGRYVIRKEIITDPHLSCVLQRTELTGEEETLSRLRMYVLCAPHLCGGGWGNNASVVEADGRQILAAGKDGVWLALAASIPFSKCSCGYVGRSDGWTDLADNFQMDWEFDHAPNGNVALTGELDIRTRKTFTLGVAFGESLQRAISSLFQSLAIPFEAGRNRFFDQWKRPCRGILPLDDAASDGGKLYRSSFALLLAHEDKIFPGAFIASMSIPWGEARGDEDIGGYHLVWTRDMVQTASALLAAGDPDTPLRALVYLAVSQLQDGGFPQNFWINGQAHWRGIQLDEVAFPILLAFRLHRMSALGEFDPYPMIRGAAAYLIRNGPATQQERWEEAPGYSPSTLASNIAALICAATFCRERGDAATAQFIEDYADFLECHLESWTVTTEGSLVPDIPKHFIRILPVDVKDIDPDEDPNRKLIALANRPPGSVWQFPAKEIVDAGFLELVRYGVRKPGDSLIEDSLRVIDALLKVDTPLGPCWRRYNHDGYGQRDDGGPYIHWGRGRAWPLLTGERAHYELAAGRNVKPLIQAIENFASSTGLLPEQIWDDTDRPSLGLLCGRPTGSAMPLMWAHAEYIKLLRSVHDGRIFDLTPEVAGRYGDRRGCRQLEIWKPNRRVHSVQPGWTLRIQAPRPFQLHWTDNEWSDARETAATPTALGISFVDIGILPQQRAPVRFTFYWPEAKAWEGRNYEIRMAGD